MPSKPMNMRYDNNTTGRKSWFGSTGGLLVAFGVMTVLLTVYTMPSGRSIRYEPSEGSPWMYDELIAPFSFPIEKSREDIARETDSLRNAFIPYFAIDGTVRESALAAVDRLFSDSLSKVISDESFRMIKDKLSEIYEDGIIGNDDEEFITGRRYTHLRCYSGNTSRLTSVERIHTQVDAYRLLTRTILDATDRHHLQHFHPEEIVMPNISYDSIRSNTELSAQEKQISRYSGMVMANQKIIGRGEIVGHDKYMMIQSYMANMTGSSDSRNFRLLSWAGNLLYAAILIAMLILYLVRYRRDYLKDTARLLFLLLSVDIFIIGTNLYMRFTSWSIFLVPCTMLALMLRLFLDSRTAFIGYLTYLLICSVSTPMPFEYILLQIVSGFIAIYSLNELSQRSQIFRTVGLILSSYCAVWLALQLIQLEDIRSIQWQIFVYFLINCFILLLTYPLILAIEKLFGFTSNVTLIELSNVNHPLLRQLAENAPGTFQHSMQVSTLAAEAANAIGASTQLVRTAALYHDIGKLANPPFYTENQNGVNPHDKLTYVESAAVITGHVTEGLKLADKYSLPLDVTHFIETHHGEGMARYFYIKYCNEHPGEEVDKSLFSYIGPNPDTKETAILMMADAVEASSRSLKEFTEESIGELIDRIIDTQVSEGFFKECPITYRDITTIKDVFKDRLKTMYHTRISYPTPNKA